MSICRTFLAVLMLIAIGCPSVFAAEKLKALIIDGQNNHDWKACTPVLRWILEECGRFAVSVSTTPARGPQADPAGWAKWNPKFADYDVLVMNYTGDLWPGNVRGEFVNYVRNGGGLVIVHAADNAFPEWPEFNEMIAVGGWGGRNEKSGPMIRYREGKVVFDNPPGAGGTHGAQHPFLVETRAPDHPVMKGLPPAFRHAPDELYAKLRGPCKNVTVLATSFSDPKTGGTNENEPILMAIEYGKGRCFHTVMGHGPEAMGGLGFQITLQRGSEWAATGQVTLAPPDPRTLTTDSPAMRRPGK